MVEEFSADLRTIKHVAHSTLRGYRSALRAFTSYISNPDYGWDTVCEQFFGTHPAQVFFDWNTAPHVQAYDGRPTKRPYTREELDGLFEHADNEVERIGKSSRKGWQAAYRDAVMMKVAYGNGLRFNEFRHLQTVDFARNPHAREFGSFGVCKVRYGKARRSSPPKPRSVLTVWRWTPGILEDWLAKKVICSTNAIESLNARYRRAVRARGHFPTEQAALKCLYLVTRSLDPTGRGQTRWTMRWKPALNAFAITFADHWPAAETY